MRSRDPTRRTSSRGRRPPATAPTATFFSNRGPNSTAARYFYRDGLAAYLAFEGPYNPGLTNAKVPVDAVTTSASGVDPHISKANAAIQAHRIAAVRKLPLAPRHAARSTTTPTAASSASSASPA